MQAGYKFLVRMLCGLCLVGGFAACQKVDLPSEEGEDTEQPGQTGDKPGNEGHEPGGADEPEDEVPLPPEYEGAWTVAGILSEYRWISLQGFPRQALPGVPLPLPHFHPLLRAFSSVLL